MARLMLEDPGRFPPARVLDYARSVLESLGLH
jgi:hypothetical protein